VLCETFDAAIPDAVRLWMAVHQQQRRAVAALLPEDFDAAGIDLKRSKVGETHHVRSCLLSLFELFVF
jgi:hypothetical protein